MFFITNILSLKQMKLLGKYHKTIKSINIFKKILLQISINDIYINLSLSSILVVSAIALKNLTIIFLQEKKEKLSGMGQGLSTSSSPTNIYWNNTKPFKI